jgi:aspartate/methionine/tyrosine aminotransferase
MIAGDDLKALAAWCTASGVRLVSDEIYHRLTYDKPASTVAGMDGVIVINSFSKYYSMTGWRLGWMIVPEDLLRPVECLAQNLFISPPSLSQWAALAAFDADEELQANVARYRHNREVLLETLPAAGFPIVSPPDGAFYLYTDVSRWTEDSVGFCARMLQETGVAATPGVDFDPLVGHRCVRFSFSGATPDMVEAARRLKDWSK